MAGHVGARKNTRIAGFEVAHFGPEVLKAVKTVVFITIRSVSEGFLETLLKAQKAQSLADASGWGGPETRS